MLFARLFKWIVFLIFGLNLLCLLAALCAPFINPKYFWPPELFGLFFRIFMLLHIFLTLIFIIGRVKPLIWTGIIAFLVCIPSFSHSIAMHPWADTGDEHSGITIMTYNVNDLSYFNSPLVISEVLHTVRKTKPDIICLQEYMNPGKSEPFIDKMKALGYTHYYEYITDKIGGLGAVGQAFFSKIPLYNIQPVPFHNTANGAVSADFVNGQDTLRLFNVHFQSVTLRQHQLKIPTSLQDFDSPQKDYYRMVFVKLMWAVRKRSYQALEVKEAVEKSPHKVIVCGDFNDSPLSFTYRQMTEKLDDSFLKTNFGMGSTFGGPIPIQRIDYILTDPGIQTGQTHVIHNPGSDHFPVMTKVWVR